MNHEDHIFSLGITVELSLLILFAILVILYFSATKISNCNNRLRKWPKYRCLLWLVGVISACLAIIGPLADRAHHDFTIHMLGHLLLGMFAPLLMALAAPMTLLLRTVPTNFAKQVTKFLRTKPIRTITHPVVATILNIGSLWVLYLTDLFAIMHQSVWLFLLIHFHILLAGYVYTISIIYVDLVSHRYSFYFRSAVLVISLAGHGILSKIIYMNPPTGVSTEKAEAGAMLMYYGGDAVDVILICILCYQWYKATRPREVLQYN